MAKQSDTIKPEPRKLSDEEKGLAILVNCWPLPPARAKERYAQLEETERCELTALYDRLFGPNPQEGVGREIRAALVKIEERLNPPEDEDQPGEDDTDLDPDDD